MQMNLFRVQTIKSRLEIKMPDNRQVCGECGDIIIEAEGGCSCRKAPEHCDICNCDIATRLDGSYFCGCKEILMLNGQTYEYKNSLGKCCECDELTPYWLHNANDYFCLREKCFRTRRRYQELQSIKNDVENLIKKLKNIGESCEN